MHLAEHSNGRPAKTTYLVAGGKAGQVTGAGREIWYEVIDEPTFPDRNSQIIRFSQLTRNTQSKSADKLAGLFE